MSMNDMAGPLDGAEADSERGESSRAGNDRYRLLLEKARVVPWEFDCAEQRFTYVGPQAVNLLGYPREAWFEPHFWEAHLHPEDRATAVAHSHASARRGRDYDFEYRMRAADGRSVWIRDLVTVEASGGSPKLLRGVMIDATDQKQAEALLKGELRALALVSSGASLSEILTSQARFFESLAEGAYCSIRLIDKSRQRLRSIAAPGLPPEFVRALDQLDARTQPLFATWAARLRDKVVVGDFQDPREIMEGFSEIARRFGFASYWCVPLTDSSGEVLGTFVVYHREPRVLTSWHQRLLDWVVQVTSIAIGNKRIQEDLQEMHRHRAEAFRLANMGMWRWHLPTDHVVWSDETYRIHGRDPGQFVPTYDSVISLILPEDRQTVAQAVETAQREGSPSDCEYRICLPDGELRHISATIGVQFGDDGQVQELAGVVTDVTERRRAEEERRNLELQLLEGQKLESLGIMAGGIAHDFNNLLVGVMANTHLALTQLPEDSPVRSAIERIDLAAQHSADLCQQLLAYTGRGRFNAETLSVNQVILDIVDLMGTAISKRAALRFSLADESPLILADVAQIRQILLNLITNASDALQRNDGIITIGTGIADADESLMENLHPDPGLEPGRYAWIEISDTGCGMDAETIERIFDPFFTTKFMGRGLGLAAVLGIVRGHGGGIHVTSQPGEGSAFRLYFPALEGPAPAAPSDDQPAALRSASGHTVLVVDDEDLVRNSARRVLEQAGFRVISARDGKRALDLVRSRRHEIDLVLLDLTMPRLSGMETLKELRRLRFDRPVILTSGYAEADSNEDSVEDPACSFLQKPYRPHLLIEKVSHALAERSDSP